MKTLILVRGIPGSGKTFISNILSENGKYPVLSADMYFEDGDGNYNFDASLIKNAHEWCRNCVEEYMLYSQIPEFEKFLKLEIINPTKIFVANTFTQNWELEPYIALAKQYGYHVVTMIVENRHGNESVHDVPVNTIEKMRQRFEIQL